MHGHKARKQDYMSSIMLRNNLVVFSTFETISNTSSAFFAKLWLIIAKHLRRFYIGGALIIRAVQQA